MMAMSKILNSNKIQYSIFLVFFCLSIATSFDLTQISAIDIQNIEYGGIFIDSSFADAQIFNPILSTDSTSKKIENLVFNSLLTYDKDINIIPQLAKSWTISSDNLDYTFSLREDVLWHDGEIFSVDDVIFTWDRILDPETDTTLAKRFECLDSYEKIDDYTVVFHLIETCRSILSYLMVNIIPEHAYEFHNGLDGIPHTIDDCRDESGIYTFNNDIRNRGPIGTGSLLFSEWNIDQNITLIRNSIDNDGPGYWNGHNTYLDKYILKIITSVDDQIDALEKGNIHMMELGSVSIEDIEQLMANESINVYSSLAYTYDHIAFQCDPEKGDLNGFSSRDFTSNPNYFAGFEWMTEENPEISGYLVRQALNYAIDKQGLIDHVYPHGLRNLGPMYLAQTEWYNENVNPYDCNLTRANELLAQAGFGTTADDLLRKELNFTISYNKGNLRREKTCIFASDQWAKLGIDVDLNAYECFLWPYNDIFYTRSFDVISSGWTGGGANPDLSNVWSSSNILYSGQPIGVESDGTWIWDGNTQHGGLNYMSYWNPEVDILLDQAKVETEDYIRKQHYDQIQEKIVDDSPYIWLFSHINQIAVNGRFSGFVENSSISFWPEPTGFRNIYFDQADDTNPEVSYINLSSLLFSLTALTIVRVCKKKNN